MSTTKTPENIWLSRPTSEEAKAAVRTLIAFIGDDPDREGLVGTPERVIKAWTEDWGKGYDPAHVDAQKKSISSGMFSEKHDAMVVVRKIHFVSHCEHHLAEFSGTVDLGYIPRAKIIGLSKLVRIVDLFSRRLQIQERLATQIADYIDEVCNPVGIGVLVTSTHSCMLTRGVHQSECSAVTSALRGAIIDEPDARAEFFRLIEDRHE